MLIKRLLSRLYYRFKKNIYGHGYQEFGVRSVIKKPIRILGKEHIAIGKSVYVLDGLRMEAVSKWGEKIYAPEISIQDRVAIGQYCHFTCANKLEIGEGSSILPNVLITTLSMNTWLENHFRKRE